MFNAKSLNRYMCTRKSKQSQVMKSSCWRCPTTMFTRLTLCVNRYDHNDNDEPMVCWIFKRICAEKKKHLYNLPCFFCVYTSCEPLPVLGCRTHWIYYEPRCLMTISVRWTHHRKFRFVIAFSAIAFTVFRFLPSQSLRQKPKRNRSIYTGKSFRRNDTELINHNIRIVYAFSRFVHHRCADAPKLVELNAVLRSRTTTYQLPLRSHKNSNLFDDTVGCAIEPHHGESAIISYSGVWYRLHRASM